MCTDSLVEGMPTLCMWFSSGLPAGVSLSPQLHSSLRSECGYPCLAPGEQPRFLRHTIMC